VRLVATRVRRCGVEHLALSVRCAAHPGVRSARLAALCRRRHVEVHAPDDSHVALVVCVPVRVASVGRRGRRRQRERSSLLRRRRHVHDHQRGPSQDSNRKTQARQARALAQRTAAAHDLQPRSLVISIGAGRTAGVCAAHTAREHSWATQATRVQYAGRRGESVGSASDRSIDDNQRIGGDDARAGR
jgi:hypothetical protein